LAVCLGRNMFQHFTSNHHVGFLCAAYYWHFVDVVWLFLWVYVYWWSSGSF
jgi:cytochrome c oxidase subunit 3